ncbi:MAG: hypothetical protein H0X14_13710, partial [Acidobacteria bacterium]|nr:hypothetical protein [Acidobacteriota bacterium]
MSEAINLKRSITLIDMARATGAELTGDQKSEVSDVTHDSRQAREGTLFVAIRGATLDGHRFVEQVMKQGAVGVISELKRPDDFRGAWLEVRDARAAMAQAAAAVHGDPSRELK